MADHLLCMVIMYSRDTTWWRSSWAISSHFPHELVTSILVPRHSIQADLIGEVLE